jgi:hypothetical protein
VRPAKAYDTNFVSLSKQIPMKGVTILTDEKKKRRILQVDIKEVAKNPDQFEDLIDVLVAESRKDEKSIAWSEAKKTLKKKGKL